MAGLSQFCTIRTQCLGDIYVYVGISHRYPTSERFGNNSLGREVNERDTVYVLETQMTDGQRSWRVKIFKIHCHIQAGERNSPKPQLSSENGRYNKRQKKASMTNKRKKSSCRCRKLGQRQQKTIFHPRTRIFNIEYRRKIRVLRRCGEPRSLNLGSIPPGLSGP